jgi:hypothetical protein
MKGSSPNPKIRCLRHTPCGRACACDDIRPGPDGRISTLAGAPVTSLVLCVQCPCTVGHVSRDRSKPSEKKPAARWIHISIPTIELDSVLDRDRLGHVIRCGFFFSLSFGVYFMFLCLFFLFSF